MAALIGWELKKLFSRRIVWVLLALGLGLFILVNHGTLGAYRFSGYAQGMKDVYRQYEGQVITETFQARVQQDFEQYALAHPELYELRTYTDDGGNMTYEYRPRDEVSGHESGVWASYYHLSNVTSLEDNQAQVREAANHLSTGTQQDGTSLPYYIKVRYEEMVREGVATPIAQYAEGWKQFLYGSPLPGWLTFAIPCLVLLSLFNGEGAARMDTVVLTAKARRRAAWAKLWTGALVVLGVVTLYFGAETALIALTWGLDGAAIAWGSLTGNWANTPMPVGGVYSLGLLAILLAEMACATIVAWASARFRHPLLTLLVAGALIFLLVLPGYLFRGIVNFWLDSPFWVSVSKYTQLLPAALLLETNTPLLAATHPETLTFIMALPLGIVALLWWRSIHHFLRRRKV